MNELVVREPDLKPTMEAIKLVCDEALAITVDSKETQETATKYIVIIRGEQKKVDEKEKEFTKPINEHLKKLRDIFKPAKFILEQSEIHLKSQLNFFYQKERELELKKQKQLQGQLERQRERDIAKGKTPVFPEVITPRVIIADKKVVTDDGSSIIYITQQKPIVTDISKVPTFWQGVQILIPDTQALQKLVDAGVPMPAGIIVKEESYIRAGR